jgi:hypothetical protein
MARRRRMSTHLPVRMYIKKGRHYYHADRGKWSYLGADLCHALARYQALEQARTLGGQVKFVDACWQYDVRRVVSLAAHDQARERRLLYGLCAHLGRLSLFEIDYDVIQKHADVVKRTRSPSECARELAAFSRVWDWARDQSITSLPNPRRARARATD